MANKNSPPSGQNQNEDKSEKKIPTWDDWVKEHKISPAISRGAQVLAKIEGSSQITEEAFNAAIKKFKGGRS